jgi:hypothetical protein
MAIDLPNLDDRTFADLVDDARLALPAIYPAWTDHNPSDPGIALVELLAWLTEMIVFRTGRIPESSQRAFLRLLSGGAHGGLDEDLDAATAATLSGLRDRYRAITPDDYEYLVTSAWEGSSAVARAHCVPERDLSSGSPTAVTPGHVSLVVLPAGPDPWAAPSADLITKVTTFLTQRRLIATQLHVGPVTSVPIAVTATIGLRDDVPSAGADVPKAVREALKQHFHPWTGGPKKDGWPFGRYVDVSDVIAVVDEVVGVDFVDQLTFALTAPQDAKGDRTVKDAATSKVLGLRIEPHELPRIDDTTGLLLTLQERRGDVWVKI